MVMYCSSKINYEQLRLLDQKGKESMRVNCRQGQPQVVAKKELQDKSMHDYYLNGLSLKEGEIYVSPLNLNMEHEQIERPLKPIVRLVTPMIDKNGKQNGFFVS